ncbi:Leo1-like protein-domain-containing protein [Amylostereum chailletii]|nr:Leo1-like protein-domain-containing protein [Amylostereum chailletii]
MSSLAGALDQPLDTKFLDHTPQDVDMQDPDTELTPSHDPLDPEPQARHTELEEDMGDLFGGDDEADYPKHHSAPESVSLTPPPADLDGLSPADRERRQALEYEEDDEPNPVIEERLEAAVAIPNVPVPKSSDGQHWVLRLPNFIKLDTKPFHPETYVGPEQEDDLSSGSRDHDMVVKLRVENTLRWRWTKNAAGQDQRQSNARVIRWSDGTSSLRLGKEYFDMNHVVDNSGSAHRQAFGASSQSQPQSQSQTTSQPASASGSSSKNHGLTYLVAQHKRAEILQAEAAIVGFMTLRPTDMASDTHRLLVRAVGQKHKKVARLRLADELGMDTERMQQDQKRAVAKKPRKPRAEGESGMGGGRRRRSFGSSRRRDVDMWSDDEEEEPEFEGSDDEGEHGRSPKKRRSAHDSDERRGAGEYQTDDFVVADSDDEDGGRGSGSGGRKRRKEEALEEEDVLDRLDAQIDAQERQERDDGPEEEEAESEEETETQVRKAGGAPGTRKRRAIDFEEDEEEEGM